MMRFALSARRISDQASSERGKADYDGASKTGAWEGIDAVRTAFESDGLGLEGVSY